MIEVKGLSREFKTPLQEPGFFGALKGLVHRKTKTVEAVRQLDFSIGAGEAVGFVGPNGAGKSTTVKMLTGILTPTAGSITVNGLTPHRDRKTLAARLGVVFGQRTQLWWDLPVIESFHLLGHIYGVPRATVDERLRSFNDLLKISEFMDMPVRKLSLGQRMRSDLVASLLHDPPLLVLDEPTIGLDVSAKDAIRRFLHHQVRERNKTLLLTTHDMTDIEELCERLVIIDHGKLLFDGGLKELKDRFSDSVHVHLEVDRTADVVTHLPDGVTLVDQSETTLDVSVPRAWGRPAKLLEHILGKSPLHEVHIQEANTEDIIRRIYDGEAHA